MLVRPNNGGCPWVPTPANMKIYRFYVPSIWLKWHVLKMFADKFHQAIQTWRLLDRVKSGRAYPCFFLAVWFQKERFQALIAANIMGNVLIPWC
jgi:hypothetical protein